MKDRPHYYRRDGKPIHDMLVWAKLFEDHAYRQVACTILEDGTRISTVWLGLDHSFLQDGPPIIFETMVFSPETRKSEILGREFHEEWACERYSTEAEAIMGHDAMVRKWKKARDEWNNHTGPKIQEDVEKFRPSDPKRDIN